MGDREELLGPSLRVALLALNYAPEPTGIAPYTTGLARGLHERGHEVRVVTTLPHYPTWRADTDPARLALAEVPGVQVDRFRHYVPANPTGVRRAVSELSFALLAGTARWGSPDVVVCPSPALFGAAAVELRRALPGRKPAIGVIAQDLYSAGITEIAGAGSTVVRALTGLERGVLRRADGVVAIHPRFKGRMVERLGVDPGRITVIRNWTHVSGAGRFDREAARAARGWRADEFVVLHTGAMGEKQALANVVDAAQLADEMGAPVRFVLAGDGGQRAHLQRRATGVRRIEFLPPVPDDEYARLLASADLLLLNERPGVAEMAVPSKLTSYFNSEVAVLAATSAGSASASEVEASGAGVRVEPGDPQALLDAVLARAAAPDETRRMGARGPDYCRSVLSEQSSLDAYADWIEALAESRRVTSR